MSEPITMQQFIEAQKLEMHTRAIKRNPHMTGSDAMPRNFECTIEKLVRHGSVEEIVTYFSQGSAYTKPPTLADVLDCLASDASGVENAKSFEDWASEYGYDTDSRKAEKTYRIIEKQAQELKSFLGADAYDTLLWNTERL